MDATADGEARELTGDDIKAIRVAYGRWRHNRDGYQRDLADRLGLATKGHITVYLWERERHRPMLLHRAALMRLRRALIQRGYLDDQGMLTAWSKEESNGAEAGDRDD